MVTVRLPGMLRKYANEHAVVDVEGSTLAQVLAAVSAAHADLGPRFFDERGELHHHLLVFHGDTLVERSRLATTAVAPDDHIDIIIGVAGGAEDVRMRGFRDRSTVEEARSVALEGVSPLPSEAVPVTASAGRVLAASVTSRVAVPPFRRATMDGYAVRADDTFGTSAYNPVLLEIIGESMPGGAAIGPIVRGQAARIMTGAPVPDGADAVLRAEDATERPAGVEVRAPVAPERNVGRIGEDVDIGTTVFEPGRRLLAHDVGLLASIGHDPVAVHRQPAVRIIVSGDELVPPGQAPGEHHIVDSNSPMLATLVIRDGGLPGVVRLPDDRDQMRAALAAPGADVIITAGAASVGTEDIMPLLVAELGELLVHGVAMRPSSPTGVGRVGDVPVLLVPGNPVSCLVAYDFFAGPVIRRLGGRSETWPYPTTRLPLRKRLVSEIGRTDYVRVVVRDDEVEPLAVRGASVLSSVTRSSGFVVVPAALEGYPEGTEVDVHLHVP